METELPEPMIKIEVLFGKSECRAWFESELMPDGRFRLVGMGSRTDYDNDRRITFHKAEPTGLVMY